MSQSHTVPKHAAFSHDKLYRAFRREIEKRNFRGPKLERDSDEETGVDWFTYYYDPTDQRELDMGFVVSQAGWCEISVGPIEYVVDLAADEQSETQWATHLADIMQMGLNGQLAIVLSVRENDEQWQAAELVWTDDSAKQRTITMVSQHEYSHDSLMARILKNCDEYQLVKLDATNIIYPEMVNGEFVLGRDIDLDDVTPLTKAEYVDLSNKLPIKLMGGDANETMWDLFYRRTEFWIVTIAVGSLLIWLDQQYGAIDAWWMVPLRYVVAAIGMGVITIITAHLLRRRQMRLDAGKTPLFEPFERRVGSRSIAGVLWGLLVFGIWYFPLWTTKENPGQLLMTAATPQVWPYVTATMVLTGWAMMLIRPRSRREKVMRCVMMALGIGTLWYANGIVMYGGDDAASISDLAMWFVLLLPIGTALWYLIDCFRKLPDEPSRDGPRAPWLIDVLCWPMVIGGLLWVGYVYLPYMVGVSAHTTAISYREEKGSEESAYYADYVYRVGNHDYKASEEIDARTYEQKPRTQAVRYLRDVPSVHFVEMMTLWKPGVGLVFFVIGACCLISKYFLKGTKWW